MGLKISAFVEARRNAIAEAGWKDKGLAYTSARQAVAFIREALHTLVTGQTSQQGLIWSNTGSSNTQRWTQPPPSDYLFYLSSEITYTDKLDRRNERQPFNERQPPK